MPEPFKEFFNRPVIETMAGHLQRVYPPFDAAGFTVFVCDGLDELELKQRSARITEGLHRFLPEDFPLAAKILEDSLRSEDGVGISEQRSGEDGIGGWLVMPMTVYVAEAGKRHFALALEALRAMTKRFTAEFAIRFFLLERQADTLAVLARWADDPNEHVRRLVSEGTRPRLPWAMRLPDFIADPTPILPLLERLRDDPSEYVRRSVANNLNDIAKDHPDLVASLAADWLMGAGRERQRLVRHACRSLIKAGHPGCLAALGYGAPRVAVKGFAVKTPAVDFGGELAFALELVSESDGPQDLVIDYAVHHRKANGGTSPKVFKWKTLRLGAGEVHRGEKRHAIRPITTRRYYPGEHAVEILINGRSFGKEGFLLSMEAAAV